MCSVYYHHLSKPENSFIISGGRDKLTQSMTDKSERCTTSSVRSFVCVSVFLPFLIIEKMQTTNNDDINVNRTAKPNSSDTEIELSFGTVCKWKNSLFAFNLDSVHNTLQVYIDEAVICQSHCVSCDRVRHTFLPKIRIHLAIQ